MFFGKGCKRRGLLQRLLHWRLQRKTQIRKRGEYVIFKWLTLLKSRVHVVPLGLYLISWPIWSHLRRAAAPDRSTEQSTSWVTDSLGFDWSHGCGQIKVSCAKDHPKKMSRPVVYLVWWLCWVNRLYLPALCSCSWGVISGPFHWSDLDLRPNCHAKGAISNVLRSILQIY